MLGNLPLVFRNLDSIWLGLDPEPGDLRACGLPRSFGSYSSISPSEGSCTCLGQARGQPSSPGFSARRFIPMTFIASGTLTAVAGVILASELQVGQTVVGPGMVPAPSFAGAMLGATSILPAG